MKKNQLDQIPIHERPRERLKRLGAKALRSDELLAILLGSGSQKEPVMELAQGLINRFGSILGMSTATIEELQSLTGIGAAKALKIKAAFELASRLHDSNKEKITVKNPKDLFLAAKPYIADEKRELFLIILLNVRNQIIGVEIISIGTLTATLVHPREVFFPAIRRKAHAIVAIHNHPSSHLAPSKEDYETTKQLIQASHIINIPLLDHLIISRDNYYSFRENGYSFVI